MPRYTLTAIADEPPPTEPDDTPRRLDAVPDRRALDPLPPKA